ncbi:hypothetical protein [Klenkia terrae]|uniref:hypothetical protein n=1 Tax=Klenkia terrae TaxID=1052259 RepID=UPI001CD88942|nr:hypothetical protein [Klenkia terrae]
MSLPRRAVPPDTAVVASAPVATGVLAVAAVLLVAGSVWPATRPVAVLLASGLAAVAPLVGLRLYRPDRRGPWLFMSASLACWTVAFAVGGAAPALGMAFQTAGMVAVAGFLPCSSSGSARGRGPSRDGPAGSTGDGGPTAP